MTDLKPFGRVLEVRPEVLEAQSMLDMVDLAHVAEQSKSSGLAAKVPGQEKLRDPSHFFKLTYPTQDVRQTLDTLNRRAQDPSGVPGVILLNGRYGAGKSHVMLAAHHALTSSGAVEEWTKEWGLPSRDFFEDPIVVTRSFIQQTTEDLWDVFFEACGREELAREVKNYPDGEMIEEALGERPVVLILDELERWYDAVDEETQSQNRNFLQALSEVSMRDGRLTLLLSVLGERAEPAETIRRTKPLELSFQSSEDRRRIILFRLFENYREHDEEASREVVYEYAKTYSEAGLENIDTYQAEFADTYPFTPEFLNILIRKVPNLGGFQNTRGTLRFLSKLVRRKHESRPVISSQDIPIADDTVRTTLSNLDSTGGEVVRRALGDNWDAVPESIDHKRELFSSIVFYSIADPSHPGATTADILYAVLDPGENPNRIKDSLRQIRQLAYNLHQDGDRFLFKTQENPHARINAVARSPQVDETSCRHLIQDAAADRWGAEGKTAFYTGDVEAVRRELKKIGNKRPKFLVSTRTLRPQQRLRLQNLDERRNTVLLIEPFIRDSEQYDLLSDDRLLEHARRIEACNRLLEANPDAEAAAAYRDVRQKERNSLDAIIKEHYGFYVRWNEAASSVSRVKDSWYELEKIDEFIASTFFQRFKENFSSPLEIKNRVRDLWSDYSHRRTSQLIDHFDTTTGEPVPYDADLVPAALRDLARSGVLGLQDDTGRTWGQDAGKLTNDSLADCTLVEPPEREEQGGMDDQKPVPPSHVGASARWDDDKGAAVFKWEYPEKPDAEEDVHYRTLVQRYTNAKGWNTGEVHSVDLDSTLGPNRYIGTDEEFLDTENITPGTWYHYYIFLVEDRPDEEPRAVLSTTCDVRVPEEEKEARPGELEISPQKDTKKLYIEIEKVVMSPENMSSDDRIEKIEFGIEHIAGEPAFDALGEDLPVNEDELEVRGRATVTLRGDYGRQEVMKFVRKLPDIESAVYGATIYVKDGEEQG